MLIEKQPTRGKRVREERQFDQTQLKMAVHGKRVHRDYAAHFFRWGWVARRLEKKTSVLDIGCGQELPLLHVLSAFANLLPRIYVGVDLNKISLIPKRTWAVVHDRFDVLSRWKELLKHEKNGFQNIVCFEVLEHMAANDGCELLRCMNQLLVPDGMLYLSTPVYNGKAAANHLHEWRIDELKLALSRAGWSVIGRVGTFASAHDIKKVLSKEERVVWDRLNWWFSGDVMSTIFACNYPDASRNNVWICGKK